MVIDLVSVTQLAPWWQSKRDMYDQKAFGMMVKDFKKKKNLLVHSDTTKQHVEKIISKKRMVDPSPQMIMKSDTTEMDADTTQVDPDTTEMDPDTTQVDPDTTEMDPDTTQVDPDTTEMDVGSSITKEDVQETKVKAVMIDLNLCLSLRAARDKHVKRISPGRGAGKRVKEMSQERAGKPVKEISPGRGAGKRVKEMSQERAGKPVKEISEQRAGKRVRHISEQTDASGAGRAPRACVGTGVQKFCSSHRQLSK